MDYDLDQRTARLSVGEFADFTVGPREGGDGNSGLWRAQLGAQWHRELHAQAAAEDPAATFEVTIEGRVFHRGWTLTIQGRIDQRLPRANDVILREIKTVTRPVPAPADELRADYPSYFAQLATYLALHRLDPAAPRARGELLFVETGTGLAQTIPLAATEGDALFRARLERITEFLDLRQRARLRLHGLRFHPAFPSPRPGQETTRAELGTALAARRHVAFEAPTGFGKTGVLLEVALDALRAGRFARLVYLTSKSTGQLQVRETLQRMTTGGQPTCHLMGDTFPAPPPAPSATSVTSSAPAVALWHVRNKAEHCVNHTFHCVRDSCAYLADVEARWPASGLSRFYLFDDQPRDLASLRAAGRAARICPYEITRTALAFQDVWIGDYNYVFAPRNRRLFADQPGWNPAETLLVIDEAHNLPSRVADAHSHVARAADARAVLAELDHLRAPRAFIRAWETYTLLLTGLTPTADALDLALEDDLADVLRRLAEQLLHTHLDFAALGPDLADHLWRVADLAAWLADHSLARLLWCSRPGELNFTCLDAAPVTAAILRTFGGTILASATLSPLEPYAASVGLDPGELHLLAAHTPWRAGAYDVAYDARVDTSYRERERHAPTTAATIADLHAAARGPVAVFFPSYAYAERLTRELERTAPHLRVALQPRLTDLAAQSTWVEESLAFSDVVTLILGSSFAEGIDLLGGRVTHAMVVGPALPEVNAVQRARLDTAQRPPASLSREQAAHRVFRAPGLQKVNQALGRLIRAPGQRARVLLHCRRFLNPAYAGLLARDYQFGATLTTRAELEAWLAADLPPSTLP